MKAFRPSALSLTLLCGCSANYDVGGGDDVASVEQAALCLRPTIAYAALAPVVGGPVVALPAIGCVEAGAPRSVRLKPTLGGAAGATLPRGLNFEASTGKISGTPQGWETAYPGGLVTSKRFEATAKLCVGNSITTSYQPSPAPFPNANRIVPPNLDYALDGLIRTVVDADVVHYIEVGGRFAPHVDPVGPLPPSYGVYVINGRAFEGPLLASLAGSKIRPVLREIEPLRDCERFASDKPVSTKASWIAQCRGKVQSYVNACAYDKDVNGCVTKRAQRSDPNHRDREYDCDPGQLTAEAPIAFDVRDAAPLRVDRAYSSALWADGAFESRGVGVSGGQAGSYQFWQVPGMLDPLALNGRTGVISGTLAVAHLESGIRTGSVEVRDGLWRRTTIPYSFAAGVVRACDGPDQSGACLTLGSNWMAPYNTFPSLATSRFPITNGNVDEAISSLVVAPGYEATVCAGAGFLGPCKTYGAGSPNLPAGVDDTTSSMYLRPPRTAMPAYDYAANFPSDRENAYSEEVQGVGHSSDHWYISNKWDIRKYHVTDNLSSARARARVSLPDGCEHFGDLVYDSGFVYVPVERCDDDVRAGRERIYRYDADLNPAGFVKLSSQTHASWLAVDPISHRFASSESEGVSEVLFYDLSKAAWGGELVGTDYRLSLAGGASLSAVQGGEFSPNGRLYVSSGKDDARGIRVFDVVDGGLALRDTIGPHGASGWDEMEGLTIWDVTGLGAPNVSGQIHWMLLGNDCDEEWFCFGANNDDQIWFKHVTVDDPRKL